MHQTPQETGAPSSPWDSIVGIISEIKRCEAAGVTVAGVAMAYICIDAMAYLSIPEGQKTQTKTDFISWTNKYLEADPEQIYQYAGDDVYAARCALLHTFAAEAERHHKDQNLKIFGYHDGGRHMFDQSKHPRLVLIGTASFLNDVALAVDKFMKSCQHDSSLRQRVESRLPSLLKMLPLRSENFCGD
tara:strand:- start:510 stop:1073 length:564 start_codon:yes stop_codon:yes gene_type:complete